MRIVTLHATTTNNDHQPKLHLNSNINQLTNAHYSKMGRSEGEIETWRGVTPVGLLGSAADS